jgi:hypothetical protein
MQVVQTIDQNVELGAALETSIASVLPALNLGRSVSSPAIKLTIAGHVYSVVVSFAVAA